MKNIDFGKFCNTPFSRSHFGTTFNQIRDPFLHIKDLCCKQALNAYMLLLTEYDRARQTFFLVKFLPPQFFLEIILGLWAKVGGSEKIPSAGPLGGPGGP